MDAFPTELGAQLRALEQMRAPELRALWQCTFGRAQPGWLQRGLLIHALSYHFQEKVLGGLSAVLRRRLRAYADVVQMKGAIGPVARQKIKPGTRLVREWGGETHVVTVLEAKFEYRGARFESLSEIARTITKTRWSGPAFFGLNAKSVKPSERKHGG
jgi:hypothetical protein